MKQPSKFWLGVGAAVVAGLVALWWWKSPRQKIARVFKYELGRAPNDQNYTAWEGYLVQDGSELKTATRMHTSVQEAKDYRAGKYPDRPKYANHYGLGA